MAKPALFAAAVVIPWIDQVKGSSDSNYDAKADHRADEADIKRRDESREEFRAECLETERFAESTEAEVNAYVDQVLPVLQIGDYLGDGLGALSLSLSLPNGDGKTVMEFRADQVYSILRELINFDESIDLASLPPNECIKRTIVRDGDKITFKLSLVKHSRTCVIPVTEWTAFLDLIEALEAAGKGTLDYYRNAVRESEANAAKKLAAAAARKPPGA